MVEIINGVKNIKNVHIGKGLTSSPIINKAYGLQSTPVVNKKGAILERKSNLLKALKY